jgi:chromatin remodeling complex protein RSC6
MELQIEREEWTPPNQNIQSLFESTVPLTTEDNDHILLKEMEKLPSTLVKLIKHLENVRNDLETQKKDLLRMNNEMKHAQNLLVRYAKKCVKQHEKETTTEEKKRGRPRGFARPTNVSAELCAFLGIPEGTLVSRTDTIVYLNKYIKENELQDPHNLQNVILDDKLARLFGGEAAIISNLSFFKMQRYLTQHFHKKSEDESSKREPPSNEPVKSRGKRSTNV